MNGSDIERVSFPGGAPHAFDEWFRPAVFRPDASSAAWQRSLDSLNWHLRGHVGAHQASHSHFIQGGKHE